MKIRRITGAIAAVAVGALVFSGCSAGDEPTQASGNERGELNIGMLGDPTSWDTSQAQVANLLQPYQAPYDSLILQEPDGELTPMLATDWSYNDDNTVLTLNLRDDVTFSDGADFDAEAVKANVEHFKNGNGRESAQLAFVDSVTVVDSDTVEYHLSAPDPSLTVNLSQAGGLMVSPEAMDDPDLATHPVGSGPYVMDKENSTPGTIYTFTPREDYWNPDLQKFDKVTMSVLNDNASRLNALLSGQINAGILDPKSGTAAKKAGKDELVVNVNWEGLLLIDREGAVNPAMGDVRVRQAINYAFDRETLLDQLLAGAGEATNQVFGPDSGAYIDALDDTYPYDPAKAKELLAAAGYEDGLTLQIPASPGFAEIYPALSQQLADVGITMEEVTISPTEIVSSIFEAKFPMAYFRLVQGNSWSAINQMIGPNAPFNPFHTTTPELQEMIDAVQYGGEESNELGAAVNEYVTENAWFAPLYRSSNVYYTDPSIEVVGQFQSATPSLYNFSPAGQ